MPRFTIEITDEQAEWVAARGREHGWSQRETIRRVIEEARTTRAVPAVAQKKGRTTKRQQVLEAVRTYFNLEPSAEAAGTTRAQIVDWCEKDPEFARALEDAQLAFVAAVETDLVAIGQGLRKGNVKALTAFLEAHHPTKYGRLKLEVLLRVLDPIVEGLMKEIREEFVDLPDRVDRIRERFESLKLKRLVAFT